MHRHIHAHLYIHAHVYTHVHVYTHTCTYVYMYVRYIMYIHIIGMVLHRQKTASAVSSEINNKSLTRWNMRLFSVQNMNSILMTWFSLARRLLGITLIFLFSMCFEFSRSLFLPHSVFIMLLCFTHTGSQIIIASSSALSYTLHVLSSA